ncbi:selenoneine biosynthesis selenosugar synthase SenB [Sulfuriferula sp.]|uniref:selenoneine biosynthesis selenosugar synthase SenB n=1 Tax=Sulfuriferula sp. TaxID=2025307 RepID=UPI0027302D49|nr:selenoneine biosynthesis selenosugar synthase SenB [Sulfuriferula sp.]MDP2027759.1 selenoneine biosynthesis selenosugar synthase SenB [Sulfuriferula sp.]
MKICLITPAPPGSHLGNRHTALRWAAMLRQHGHQVELRVTWDDQPADLMLALHARRSADSIARFHAAQPHAPLIVALTGTDIYRDIQFDAAAQRSLTLATRIIVLQDQGLNELAPALRAKTYVVYQSAATQARRARLKRAFEVCVIGHLRPEKDPFRAVEALRLLSSNSRIRIRQLGQALDANMAAQAQHWMQSEPRYRWLGDRPHGAVMRQLARAPLMVISSYMEGGANVICEAVAVGTPVIASAIPGNLGMPGMDYAGYYPPGDTAALATLLDRAERDPAWLAQLAAQCAARRPLFLPRAEAAALLRVIEAAPTLLKEIHYENQLMDTGTERTDTAGAGG